jgi:hypothetical protein
VGSQKKFKRNWGFWVFLLSNVLWIVWGLHDHAYALIFLQLCLAFLSNIPRSAVRTVVRRSQKCTRRLERRRLRWHDSVAKLD